MKKHNLEDKELFNSEFEYFRVFTEETQIPENISLYDFKYEFFLGDINNKIKIYKINDNLFYIAIFEQIFKVERAALSSDEINENLSNLQSKFDGYKLAKDKTMTDYCYIYFLFSNVGSAIKNNFANIENIVSYAIRGSYTLEKTSENYMLTKSVEILASQTGLYAFSPYFHQRLRFIMLYCLAIHYIKKTRNYILKAANYKNNKELVSIRKEILEYDVRYFFKNPVKQSRYEVYAVYDLIAKNYKINELYSEVREQIKDMAKILEIEIHKEKEERYNIFKKIAYFLTFIITLANILPAIDAGKNILTWLGIIK